MEKIRLGDSGAAVVEIRTALQLLRLLPSGEAAIDSTDPHFAVYDGACALAVRQFQQDRGLVANGEVDDDTYRELLGARHRYGERVMRYNAHTMQRGDDVRTLQQLLSELGIYPGNVDGIFGRNTEAAVASFQREYALDADGVCGPKTIRALSLLGPKVTGGSPSRLRAQAQRRTTGPALTNRVIALDSAGIPGADSPERQQISWSLLEQLRDHLTVLGARPVVVRDREQLPDASARAHTANTAGAELYISVQVSEHSSAQAEGMAVFYFGSGGSVSELGEDLAELVRREVRARTSFLDLGAHPRVLETLRQTAMPAVHIEIGYLTNPADRDRLRDARIRSAVVEGVIAAIQRFCLSSPQEYPTGTWHFPFTKDARSPR